MAKKWEEVASNPEYQNLSSSEKEDVRKEYFENVVKPNVPSEDLAKAQKDFDQFSNPSAARKAINAIKSGVTLFKDAAYDAIDNRTLSEKGLLTSKESDENAMSRKVPGVPLRVDYFDKLKQQDRIAPKSIDAMAGTKGATARAADTVIAERPFNADVNQGTNDAIYGEPQKQIPFDERKREERRLEAEAKAKLFTESLKQAGETRSADQALQQAVNKKPSQEEVTNVANQIAHKEEMQAMYGDIPKPEGMDVATNAAGRAVKTGSALAQNMIAFGSSVVNADDLALKFLQSAAKTQDEAGQYPAALKDFTEIQSWSDVPTYALEGVIENAPMLVGSIGSGALGAFTAKNLGKNKLAKLTQEAAVKELAKRATIGATVGAGTASIGMESGSIFGDIYRETGEQRTALAAAGGIVAGAFDAIPAVMALKTALGGKVGEEAAKTIIKRYGVDGLKQIGAEGGTEFAQTWVEEIAKARASGNDVLSQQNLINSLDAMFKGGAAGGVTHIAAQGFNDLTAKKVEKFKTLPNENLQRLRATAEKAMPQDVPLIDAEIQRRANTPTLQRAVEAGMREGGITQPAETLPASDILENENDGISDATSILATETDGLGLDNTEGSRGDIPETTGSGTVSDWIIDSTRPLEQGDGGDLSVRGNDSEGKPDVTLNDVTAHAAATSDLNDTPQPTEAQKEAGNYKKGSVKISGMDISVENPHTSTRSGVDKDGTAWENQQNGHYGYIKGVVARSPDKEHVDVNVKPNTAEDYAGDVFVINQNHPGTGKFDEPKVYIGYGSKDEAEAAYRSNYTDGWNGLDSVAQIPMSKFKEMLNDKKAFLKPIVTANSEVSNEIVKDKNGFITNKSGTRTIISQHEKGSNFLDPAADVGALTYIVKGANNNDLNMVLNKDGKLVPTKQALNEDSTSNGTAWIPSSEESASKVKALLENRAANDVASNERKAIDEQIKEIVANDVKSLSSDLINTKGKENGLQKQGQKTAQKINKQTPKVNSLLSKIFNLGGVTINDKLDVTGQDKSFAPGGYNKIFKKQSNQSLRGLIENGDLDEFLPYNMRVSAITQDSNAYDSADAYDYLADKIRNGEKVLPYEAQQEIEQNKFNESLTVEEHIDLVAETLTEDEINEEFRIAANEEREASILATDFIPDNEDGVIESSQREATGKQTEPQTVATQEREGVRLIVEAIAKRRAAANQINKAKAFDVNLQLAKDFMAGKDVKPVKFTTAATLFNKDSVLNESFNKLATMAKAPAKEARAEKANIVESYKQRISEAKTQDALQTIAGEIQRDSALSDTQAQALDDIVFDAQDKFETSEPEAESLTVQTRRKELENAQGIWAKEPSSLVKIALVRQAEKKLNEALEISNDVNAETTNDSDINKQSSKEVDDKQAIPAADLLNDNTAAKQAIADAERAKDAKRNEGIADTEGFALTGSNSEADKATAMGAQDLFAQPKDETPTNQDEVNYNGVRLYKIKVRNRIEGQPPTEMWAVESLENKARKERGERALGGDTLSESLEEAKSEADLMLKRDAENKQAQALQNEYDNAQQEQARTEAEKKSDIDGFGAELNAMQLGKLKETLNKPTSIKGEVLPLRDTVRKLVAQGGKPEIKEENVYKGMSRAQYNRADNRTQQEDEKRIRDGGKKNVYYITMPDGGMYDLGKTAHDFAEHLISKKNSDVEEEKPQLELTGNELTKKSGALKDTSDVGIEMLGNRRNKGLTLNDIQNADNDTERVAMAVKNKLWEKPDYQALVDSGIQPIFAHIVKQVYDSLSTKPAYKGEKMLYDYVNTVEATKKAVDELLTNNNAMAEMTIAVAVKARQQSWMMSNSITELGEISKEIKANENALNFLVDRVFPKNEKGARWGRQNTEGNDKANATGNRFYKNISLDLSSFVDAIKAVEQGFPAKQEAWERSYQIKEKDGKFQVIKKGRFTPKSEHATHEEAVNAARELVKRQREEQFKEPETPVEKSVRKGREIRTQGNVSSQELKETIGLKAVNFGDWMKQPSNAKERQEHVNSAFDAFHDLAEVINVPVKAMSLDGMLGLAIGAQGKGKFAAHFYPGYNEINLTREKGAGSLAHEWAHGLDHYFGVKAGLATRDNPFASWIGRYSNLPESNIRKEVADAFNAIVKTMRDTTETVDAAKARIEATAKASKDRLNSYIERNGLKDAVKDDAKAQSALDAIIAGERGEYIEWPALKGKRKPQGFTSEHVKVLADKLGWNFDRAYDLNLTLAGYSSAQEALKTEPTLRNIHTEYYREASRLDAGKKDSYWTTSHELFARAFEMYVADKIANADGRNDYLVAAWKQAEEIKTGNAFADEILNEAKKRYPQGNERKAINDAFDVLFKEIQTKESDDGNVVMFSRSKSTQQIYENRIDDLFADGKADFKGTGVKVLDKSDMLNLLGYGDKPVYLSENKVQQGKYNHGLTAEHWKKIPEWLDDPALVFDSDTVTGRLVFIAPELLNGAPIRIIVDPDATANGLKINLVVNAYDAKGKLPFGRWVKDGLLRFYSKAKSLAILARSGLQLSSMAKARSSNGRIYQDSDLVNYKNEDKTNFSRSDAKLPAMREKIMGGLPLFAQGNKKVGMPIADVEKEVKNFSKGWKRIPQVIVVDSMQDERINEHVRNTNKQMIENGATGLPIGFISQGKVYILAPMVNNKSDIATVMMHEIFGHAGLRANFGTKLDDILEQIYITRRKEVLAKAKQYGYDFTKHADRLKAAEEVLAEMAQTNPQLGFVKRAIAAIRAWLRANIPYYKNLEITDEDIIGNILIPARNFILKGKTGGSDLGLKKVTPVFKNFNEEVAYSYKTNDQTIYWHGSVSGDLRGGTSGLHLGTKEAARQALEARIGIPAKGEWDGTREYGKTLLAGKKTQLKLAKDGRNVGTGQNSSAPDEDYYPTKGMIKYADGTETPLTVKPDIKSYRLTGLMTNTRNTPHDDFKANGYMAAAKKKGNAKSGYYYRNIGEDAGSISVVVPNGDSIEETNNNENDDIRFSRQVNLTPEWDAPEASKIDSLIYTLQDKHIDLKRVTENIKNVGNHIDDRWNAYLQEELYHGRAAKRTQDFIKHELEPLIKDMQERKVTMADFEEYLWMRHAPERNKKMASINEGSPDGLAGVSTKDAKEYLANLTDQQKLDFEALAERIDAINKASEQVLIDYGLESTDTIAKWNSVYEYYVPLMREEMENGSGNGTGQGFSVKGNASKRATGSKRAVVDIIANIAQQRERYIIRGEKNRVSTALIGLAKLNPNEDFWRTDTPPTKKDVSKITGMVEEYTDPNYKNRDNVIVARIPDKLGKIQERSVIFNEFDDRAMRMARSLKNLDQDQLHEVLGTASIITRYFSSINTQYNPIFGVINLLRDTQTAAINLSSTPLKGKQKEVMSHVLPALIGIYSDLRSERESGTMPTNEYAILFEEFQKEGGQTGYRDMYRNAKERSAAIENALDHEWWTKTKIGKAISANGKFAAAEVWMNDKAVKPIFNWLSDYNEAMENAVRLSAYKVAIDNGLSKQQAASIAKNISVNFNRKGEMGRQIGSLYAFFNASVQGTARIADTLLKNDDGKYSLSKTGKTIVKGGLLLGVMQALLLAAAGYSDDDPPAYSKDRNLIIPLDIFGADNKYATIALPLGFNAIPAFSRHITEWALSGGEDTHDRVIQIIDMILNVTNPIGNAGLSLQTALPTLADPLAAIAENKDFTGRDISRKDFNQLDPTPGFTRSRDKAWDVSIAVARAMNWASGGTDYQPGWASPTADQIEYLAGQVTGGVGREIIKAGTTVDALISGEDLPSYKIPLLGRFYGDAASQSSQGAKFYKNITELNKIENELKGRAKNHEDVNSFKENNPEYRAIVTARISLEQVQNLRKRQRAMVEKGEDKEKIKDIDEKITMIMTRLNTKVEDYRSQANE